MATPPITDERGRLVIHLPNDATLVGWRTYLPVVADHVAGQTTRSLLRERDRGIDYDAQYSVFSLLCSDRAQRVVDKTLLVQGKPITPERYLGLWRNAIESSVSLDAAARDHGLHPFATLSGPLALLRSTNSSWTCCPFGSFTAFEAKYGEAMQVNSEGNFTLEIALASQDGARDAYYGASMLSSALRKSDAAWQAFVTLRQSQIGLPFTVASKDLDSQEA